MTAETLIDTAISNANAMRGEAATAITAAISKLGYFSPAGPPSPPNLDMGGPVDIDTNVPQYNGGGYVPPPNTTGSRPTTAPIPGPAYAPIPTDTSTKPDFVVPDAPAALREFDTAAPDIDVNNIVIPDMPAAITQFDFTPPESLDITLPSKPTVTVPQFTALAPDTEVDAPTDYATALRTDYDGMSVDMRTALNTEIDALRDKMFPTYEADATAYDERLGEFLQDDLSTATPAAVEEIIINRTRVRLDAEYKKLADTATNEGASKGFTIPPGSITSALIQARTASLAANAVAFGEITAKTLELEQQHRQWAMAQQWTMRSFMITTMAAWFTNLLQLNAQAIEYAKTLLNASVQLYESQIKLVAHRMEAYKVEAGVFDVRMRAALAEYEAYKAEVQVVEAQVGLNSAAMQGFSAQMNGLGALAQSYNTRMQGAMALAQLEKTKAELFGAQVQAFAAEVGAKNAEWSGFSAKLQGESAKQSAYEAEQRAYSTRVQARSSEVQSYSAQVSAIGESNAAAIKGYTASIEAYKADVQASAAVKSAEIASFDTTIRSWGAGMQAAEANARIRLEQLSGTVRNSIELYKTNASLTQAAARNYTDFTTSAAQVAVSAAGVYGNMAASAMAGVNGYASDIVITNS